MSEKDLAKAIDGFVVYQQARFRYLLAFCFAMFIAQIALLVMAGMMISKVDDTARSLIAVERTTSETRDEVDKKPSIETIASALPSAIAPILSAPASSVSASPSVKGPLQ